MSIRSESNGGVITITLDRPEKLNAFAGSMREDLLAALNTAGDDGQCRALIITGAGRAFSAGGDVEYMAGLQKTRDTTSFGKLLDAGRDVVLKIASLDKPVIAAVNGIAAGAGCNLALACDYRIASSEAKFGQTFVRIGLHPDWGGTWFLPRLVGRSRAFELMTSGRMVAADEALSIGLADAVVPPSEVVAAAMAMANALAAAPPIAVAGIKRAIRQSESNELGAQLDLEATHQAAAFASADATEGMQAFFEKRSPLFRGK